MVLFTAARHNLNATKLIKRSNKNNKKLLRMVIKAEIRKRNKDYITYQLSIRYIYYMSYNSYLPTLQYLMTQITYLRKANN